MHNAEFGVLKFGYHSRFRVQGRLEEGAYILNQQSPR